MGIITLTDRISVRVSAKNDTQSNDYKKATGGAIANKLGNGNVSDSLKSQLGNTKNPTITDENGDTWVSMEDMIDAGKAMNAAGAFEEIEVHEGITYNGTIYNLPSTYYTQGYTYEISPSSSIEEYSSGIYKIRTGRSSWYYMTKPNSTGGGQYVTHYGPGNSNAINDGENGSWTLSNNQISGTWYYPNRPDGYGRNGLPITASVTPTSITIGNTSYDLLGIYFNSGPTVVYGPYNDSESFTISGADLTRCIAGFLYGGIHTEGGSDYDWSKSDAEIEESIRHKNEVWDVVQNAVSSSSPTAKIPVGPYVNVGHIDDSWDSGSGGGHTGGDF